MTISLVDMNLFWRVPSILKNFATFMTIIADIAFMKNIVVLTNSVHETTIVKTVPHLNTRAEEVFSLFPSNVS